MKTGGQYRIVLVTCATPREARHIATAVVEKRLAACANILGPVQSVYRWKGKIEGAREFLLVIKTVRKQLVSLEREIKRLHSYDIPEFLVLSVAAGSNDYLKWLLQSL